jgi:hypothetical protein
MDVNFSFLRYMLTYLIFLDLVTLKILDGEYKGGSLYNFLKFVLISCLMGVIIIRFF